MFRCSCNNNKYNCSRYKANAYECQTSVIDVYIKIALFLYVCNDIIKICVRHLCIASQITK